MTVASIGSKIRKIREIKGIKQEVMAERLDITQQSYSNIEADKIDVAFSKIEKIAGIKFRFIQVRASFRRFICCDCLTCAY